MGRIWEALLINFITLTFGIWYYVSLYFDIPFSPITSWEQQPYLKGYLKKYGIGIFRSHVTLPWLFVQIWSKYSLTLQ